MKTKRTRYAIKREASPQMLNDRAVIPGTPEGMDSASMVRTQIYLSPSELEYIQTEAKRRGLPMAAVIRSFIDEKMALPDDVWENNPMLQPPADSRFLGPEDGVINHDHHIYGSPRKWMKRQGKWVPAPPLPEDYYSNQESRRSYDRMVEGAA